MSLQEASDLDEVMAIQRISEAFSKLNDETKHRVVRWMIDKYQINQKHSSMVLSQNYDVLNANVTSPQDVTYRSEVNSDDGGNPRLNTSRPVSPTLLPHVEGTYETFDELYTAASPQSDADKSLVAAYWLQEHKSQEHIDTQAANNILKDLGYPITNITRAFNSLETGRPQYVRLLKKEGSTRQARKSYKVTAEGCKRVKSMLGGHHEPMPRSSPATTRTQRSQRPASDELDGIPIQRTDRGHSQFSQMTTRTIAAQLKCKTGPDLVFAACGQLTLIQSQESFSRQQILDEIKLATGFYKSSFMSNLSNYIQNLLKNKKLLEQTQGIYALSSEARSELEVAIDCSGTA